jgi:seryl-tRNA synthetase
MLDLNLIREDPERVRQGLRKRLVEVDLSELLAGDAARRDLIARSEELKAKRNKTSAEIPRLKKQGSDVSALMAEMKAVSDQIKSLDAERSEVEARVQELLDALPNLPDDDVPAGGKEANQVLRTGGTRPEPSFRPRDHVALCESLGLIDYERGVKLGGTGFWIYRGMGARLEWALINYFIREHQKDGYELVLPPHLLNYACGYTAGQFPKFAGDVFAVARDDKGLPSQFLLPTAETALVNLYRDEILREEQLPMRFCSYTPCYRREAGSYRTEERGTIRGHQFNKVEMVQYTTPEGSDSALEEMIRKAERLVEGLGLHFRLSKLAAADCSAAMARTFDIEVWIPSIGEFKEVSSASNARDYQARRGNIRYKPARGGKNAFVHTLNASGLATSRVIPALCEQHQQADGSVVVPQVLREWVGVEVLKPL